MYPIDPARTAFVMMDLQHATLAPIPDAPGLLERISRIRHAADTATIEIVHIRVAFTPQQRTAISPRNKIFAPLRDTGLLADDSPEAQFHANAAPMPHEQVFTKNRVGAFNTTALDNYLRGRNIDTLLLAGVHTSGAVLSTVRDAADRDFRVIVLQDCCADPDAAVHEMLMNRVFPPQADVIDVQTALAATSG
ncbi:cysteine hydrolase family protein [Nocardia aurantiaca]|uniref:Isochorismatase family protein n=1 Tax=Nocardia aurantiaca TaxID=2675850 RepID=A0A6I3L780_9NOCA|nr:cysteine hydrolase [Nocardia aurantiaca]MTE16820.1 isochorismatase family protein [Nocardia aurantiaca]